MSSSTSFSKLSITPNDEEYDRVRSSKGKSKANGKRNDKPNQSTKMRGRDHDSHDIRVSKTLSWLLRHAAASEGLQMRADGYVKVSEIVTGTFNIVINSNVAFSSSITAK